MASATGWRVERCFRTAANGERVTVFRVSWKGYWQADCTTSDEVAAYVDLSDLVPVVDHSFDRVRRPDPAVPPDRHGRS